MSLLRYRNEASTPEVVHHVGIEVRDTDRTDGLTDYIKECGIYSRFDQKPHEALEQESGIFQ